MTETRTPRAGTTTAAAVINFVLTGLMLLFLLAIAAFVDSLGDWSSSAESRKQATNLAGIIVLVGLVVGTLFIWAGIAVLQRRAWGRWTLVVLYTLSTLNALLGMIGVNNGGFFVIRTLWLVAQIAVVFLLLASPTFADFENARRARDAAPAGPASPAALAGWYPDPSGSGGQRYWDGRAWTEHEHASAET